VKIKNSNLVLKNISTWDSGYSDNNYVQVFYWDKDFQEYVSLSEKKYRKKKNIKRKDCKL
jgi:hypothetical protein